MYDVRITRAKNCTNCEFVELRQADLELLHVCKELCYHLLSSNILQSNLSL